MNEPRGSELRWPLRQIGKHSPKPLIPWVEWTIDLIIGIVLIKAMTR